MPRKGPRPHRPAEAPTLHGVRLRQRVDRHRTLGHAGQARDRDVLGVVGEARVDLVAQHPEVVALRDRGDCFQLLAGGDQSGRVVRSIEEDRPRARRHRTAERVRVEAKALGRRERNIDPHRARRIDHAVVGHVARLEDGDLVAGIGDAQRTGKQRTLRAREHHHVLRAHRLCSQLLVVTGDGLAQQRIAGGRPVARAPAPHAAPCFIDDRRRGVEVRVAYGQQDHVLARLLPLPGEIVDIPHPGGFDVEAAGERGVVHGSISLGAGGLGLAICFRRTAADHSHSCFRDAGTPDPH